MTLGQCGCPPESFSEPLDRFAQLEPSLPSSLTLTKVPYLSDLALS